jgi:uncharacterized protein (TIRG00374 family)
VIKKRIIQSVKLAFYILGIVLLLYMINDFGFKRLWKELVKLGWGLVLLIPLAGAALFMQSLAWWVCIDHSKSTASLKDIYITQIAGWAVGEVAPLSSAMGETFKGYMIRHHLEPSTVFSSLLLFNTIHTLVTITMFCLGLGVTLFILKASLSAYIISYSILFFLLVLIIFLVKGQKKGFVAPIFRQLSKIKFLKPKIEPKIDHAIKIDEEMGHFWKNKKLNFLLSYIFLWFGKLGGILEMLLILYFLNYTQSFLTVSFMFIVTSAIQIVLFFVPSQVGVFEGGLNRTFVLLSLNPTYGTLLGVIRRIRVICWAIIGFLVIFFTSLKKTGNSR